MTIFKEIFIFDQNGSLFAMIPYLRHMAVGEISVTALGADNDSLDHAIIDAVKSCYPNAQFQISDELNDEQIKGNLKSFGEPDGTVTCTLRLISKQVFTINLTVWIGKNIHFQDREKIIPFLVEFRTERNLNKNQVESLEALKPPAL